jgi:hypothetical protein
MTYKISMIKGNMLTFYIIFLITVFAIFITNIGEDIDLIKFYYLLDGALFFLIYQLTCIADSTWTLDEKSFSVKGASIFLSKRNNDVTIPFTAISAYTFNRRTYYNYFVIKLKSNASIIMPMVKYGSTANEFANFMNGFELLYAQAKNAHQEN